MPDKNTSRTTKRRSQSQRKHIRRMKQDARKTGVPYIASQPMIVKPTVAKK
jgi:hypothetical protein